jgi:PRTRC genetic system protein B
MVTQMPPVPQVQHPQEGFAVAPENPLLKILGIPPEEKFDYLAALYFLEDGHYLFRYRGGHSTVESKFVTAADVKAAFSHAETDSGWIDPGIVRCGYGPQGNWFVQFLPMQRIEITLAGISWMAVPVPPLVLYGYGRTYGLFALKSKHFSPGAQVFAAPFPNVNARDGKICWGNNTPPEANTNTSQQAWKLFLEAPFTEHTIEGKSKKYPADIRPMLKELAEKSAGAYPLGDLVLVRNYRNTVESLLHDILKGG